MPVVAACVLNNWCIIEDDGDISSFDDMDELETEGHLGVPANAILGVGNGSSTHKRDQICRLIAQLQ